MVVTSAAIDAVSRVVSWAESRPDQLYSPGPTVRLFLGTSSRLALILAANQIGKTTALCAFADRQCVAYTGAGGPGVFLYMIADLDNHYPTISEKYHEVCARGLLDPACKYVDGRGFYTHGRRLIKYANGATVEFRGGKGERMSAAGITCDLGAACDEIPQRGHFAELMRAAQRWMSPVRVGFTAVGRPVDWFRQRVAGVDGAPPDDVDPQTGEPMWEVLQCGLTRVECPWMTDEQIALIYAQTDPAELPQRINGEWEGPTPGRRLNGMSEANEVEQAPQGEYRLHVIMDHGEHVGHEHVVGILEGVGRSADLGVYVIDEYVNDKASDPREDAAGVEAMLNRHGFGLLDVDVWTGDVNSGGKAAPAHSVNQLFEEAFAELLGVPERGGRRQCPFKIGGAEKGAGSVAFGEKLVNLSLMRGDLKLCAAAKKTRRALWSYRGTSGDPSTHAVDTIRYGLTPILRKQAAYSRLFIQR